jgi:hypothetical protein
VRARGIGVLRIGLDHGPKQLFRFVKTLLAGQNRCQIHGRGQKQVVHLKCRAIVALGGGRVAQRHLQVAEVQAR